MSQAAQNIVASLPADKSETVGTEPDSRYSIEIGTCGYVYGGSATVEPEGFELESKTWFEPCPKCNTQAFGWRYEVAEGAISIGSSWVSGG